MNYLKLKLVDIHAQHEFRIIYGGLYLSSGGSGCLVAPLNTILSWRIWSSILDGVREEKDINIETGQNRTAVKVGLSGTSFCLKRFKKLGGQMNCTVSAAKVWLKALMLPSQKHLISFLSILF